MSEPEQQAVVLAGVQKGDASGGKVVLKRPERHLAAVKAVPKQTELEEDEYIEGLSNIVCCLPRPGVGLTPAISYAD